jgi:hypothetical protein
MTSYLKTWKSRATFEKIIFLPRLLRTCWSRAGVRGFLHAPTQISTLGDRYPVLSCWGRVWLVHSLRVNKVTIHQAEQCHINLRYATSSGRPRKRGINRQWFIIERLTNDVRSRGDNTLGTRVIRPNNDRIHVSIKVSIGTILVLTKKGFSDKVIRMTSSDSSSIIWSISIYASPSDEIENNQYRWKLFIIWRSLHCLALAYFLNPPYSSLKYAVQFFLIHTIQNLLQGFKKLVFVSHLNPFAFFFDRRKQVEVTGRRDKSSEYGGWLGGWLSGWVAGWLGDWVTGWLGDWVGVACSTCHVLRANLLKPDLCELSNYRDESQVVSDAAPFLEERSLVQVEWTLNPLTIAQRNAVFALVSILSEKQSPKHTSVPIVS